MANLILSAYEGEEEILSEAEQDIYQYICCNKDENYDNVLAGESRWPIFFHLSEMRTSILNWYDFGENKAILEIGGGFGAITGMLCRRAKSVTVVEKSVKKAEAISIRYQNRNNLTVYGGNVEEINFKCKFDYVIITGAACDGWAGTMPEEQLYKYIKSARSWLKSSGILLLAVDNYNGARYQCGYPRPVCGSFHENGCEALITKKRLEEIITREGLTHIKFYYPFPDYKLAQEIYTDERLPEGSIKDRVLTYYVLPGMLDKNEYQLYEEEIQTGDIRNICNSYLVECSADNLNSMVDYVAVSTDRGKMHSFATVIDNKNQVTKSAVYEEGKKYLRESYDNILKIQGRGINIVPHNYQDGKLIMPLIRSPKLVDWLFFTAAENNIKFVQAIDKMRESIVKSSRNIEKNGKIYLENGYIDMIPLNCFIEEGEYYFFDQEFCEKNCSLDYIMFRVLRYTYLTYPNLEQYVSINDMKERYGLTDSWQAYRAKEDEFIWNNRQHGVNHSFYEWIGNGKINKPIVCLDEVCGLYLSEGFDVLEKNESNIWAWAIKEHAGVFIRNYRSRKIKVRISFWLGPPPGKELQTIGFYSWNESETKVKAPEMFEITEEIQAYETKYLNFKIYGQLVHCDNGDPRSFAFQLLNPRIILE